MSSPECLRFPSLTSLSLLGIDFGEHGDNLPRKADVVHELVDRGIKHARVHHTYKETMTAFANSGIELVVGIMNADFVVSSAYEGSAVSWLNSNVVPYASSKQRKTRGSSSFRPGQNIDDYLFSMFNENYNPARIQSMKRSTRKHLRIE
ncbi:hypothetical protein AXG93_4689s1160 [Marchantia polymorpha subsp. ruderalis]|uniref:Glucan endo-1,3-beta-D-glucosidase n=1 Tax=Marchantia polymorpha subsp. ruderalis TaxID=1480154 RepID=A0A176WKA6_MARPO|nr:hypothetical protein AXG93_4689s1160 [Marchantia polymorpha subsp. ruderalis]